jgi:hypothetical protein
LFRFVLFLCYALIIVCLHILLLCL